MPSRVTLAIAATVAAILAAGAVVFFRAPYYQEAKSVSSFEDPAATDLAHPKAAREAPTARRSQIASEPEHSPLSTYFAGTSAAEALQTAIREFGEDDYRVSHLTVMTHGLCNAGADPEGVMQGPIPDAARVWAIEALLAYCEDFSADLDKLPPTRNAPESVLRVERRLGPEAAASYARDVLGGEVDLLEFHEAALYLLEHGHSPTVASLGLPADGYGFADQQRALLQAVKLFVCDLSGGCGSYNPLTLGYCIEAGCRPGSTLWSAYRDNLSQGDYWLVSGYYNWLRQHRLR
jgi:hypothetical protein